MDGFIADLFAEFNGVLYIFNSFFLSFHRSALADYVYTIFFLLIGLGSITALLGLIGSGLSSASTSIKRSSKK